MPEFGKDGVAFSCADLSTCSIANLGTKGHGLLDDLNLDHHTQYAKADKTRPSPWVSAADLSARSIADLGSKGHGLLDDLLIDHHTQYALLAGRSGGQVYKGGIASGEHLTLWSTAHATKGYIKSQDDLHLVTGLLRRPDGSVGITLANTLPHVKLSGEARLGNTVGIGTNPATGVGVKVAPSLTGNINLTVMDIAPTVQLTGNPRSIKAIKGMAIAKVDAGATALSITALDFTAFGFGAGTINDLFGIYIRNGLQMYTGPACPLSSIRVRQPMIAFSTMPTTIMGVEIENQAYGTTPTWNAIGLRIHDQLTTTGNKYIIEAGPATPYLRLVGGAAPGAGLSNLWLNFAGVLKQIQEDAVNTAGAGFRRLRVVN